MAKIISYKYLSCEVNHGTDEAPNIEQVIINNEATCKTQADFDIDYPIIEQAAIPGTIKISGEFDTESDVASTDDVLNALLGVSV